MTLFAYCEDCKTLFLEVIGLHTEHVCPPGLERDSESAVVRAATEYVMGGLADRKKFEALEKAVQGLPTTRILEHKLARTVIRRR
jgi:hypothetical protein